MTHCVMFIKWKQVLEQLVMKSSQPDPLSIVIPVYKPEGFVV